MFFVQVWFVVVIDIGVFICGLYVGYGDVYFCSQVVYGFLWCEGVGVYVIDLLLLDLGQFWIVWNVDVSW